MLRFISDLVNWRPRTVEEVETVTLEAERAERSIEARMENVAARLERGGFRRLAQTELDELAEDLDKILEFVEHALAILETSARISGLDASLRRLRYVRTRIQTLSAQHDDMAQAAS